MSTLKTNTLTGTTSADAINVTDGSTTASLQKGLGKIFINFNGESTVSTRASINVSSLDDDGTGEYGINYSSNMDNTTSTTDNGSGDYTQTYTNAMNNDDYSVVGSVRAQSTPYLNGLMIGNTNSGDKSAFISTSSVRVTTNYAHHNSGAREDRGIVNTQIAGDLA